MQHSVFKRKIEDSFQSWKPSARRKPLILRGARQVGKSFVIREFGKRNYQKVCEFNFEKTPALKKIFEKLLPEEHLIFLDEIQECPLAL